MFDHILSILFPERCKGCGKNGTALCYACLADIRPASALPDGIKGLALFDYGERLVQKAVWELKYHRKSPLAKRLAVHGATNIQDYIETFNASSVILVPIPQHYSKTLSRGFNQSLLVAQWIQNVLPYASIQTLLQKYRSTLPQARTKGRQERMENLEHSMGVRKGVAIDGTALYIIVDDVITTGSTVREAGRTLRAAGAKNICAVALAHGYARHL